MQRYYYLCKSWQALLQQVVAQFAFGYIYYHIVEYPQKKRDKWLKIDEKLINKYQTKKSKFQRSRIKAQGDCNFYFLRFENIAVILHTKGKVPKDINYDDEFKNLYKNPMLLKVSERIIFKIQRNTSKKNKISVFLERNSYKNIKEQIYEIAARTKNKQTVINEFKKLNGLPAYSGIHQQKTNLRKALIQHCRKHHIKIKQSELYIRTKRNIVEVFDKSIYMF